MNDKRLLEEVVNIHDRKGEPVEAEELSECLGANHGNVIECLESLESYELVKRSSDDGYVPTVTAEELLELDMDQGDLFIMEFPDRESNENE